MNTDLVCDCLELAYDVTLLKLYSVGRLKEVALKTVLWCPLDKQMRSDK